jgi:hypothetical protein
MPTDVRTGYIYALAEPESGEVRYVGKTVRTPEERLRNHIAGSRNTNSTIRIHRWLRKINVPPQLFIIESVPEDELDDAERHWIFVMRMIGCQLTNLTQGGDGGTMMGEALETITKKARSPESRAKKSADAKARWASPEFHTKLTEIRRNRKAVPPGTYSKIAESQRGKKASPETRAKLSEIHYKRWHTPEAEAERAVRQAAKEAKKAEEKAMKIAEKNSAEGLAKRAESIAKTAESNRGKRRSPEVRAILSAAQKKRFESPEERARLSAAMTGKTASPETREKLSAIHTGKPRSAETREKISKGNKGKKRTAEQRANIAAAQRARREREQRERNE